MTASVSLADLLSVLRPVADTAGRLTAGNVVLTERVVFGGQLIAQAIAAAAACQPDKAVLTVHTAFCRGGDPTTSLDVDVEDLLRGRAFGAVTVTFRQRSKVCARAQVELTVPEPDAVRHAPPPPILPGPDPATLGPTHGNPAWLTDVVGGIDIMQVDQELPARLAVWSRWPDAPTDPLIGRQLLAWASDPWLIGTAMLPHLGFGQQRAHDDLSTGVITHTITFHDDPDASTWLLLDQEAHWAGAGRVAGRGLVYAEGGRLVASFTQDAMVRHLPDDGGHRSHPRVL